MDLNSLLNYSYSLSGVNVDDYSVSSSEDANWYHNIGRFPSGGTPSSTYQALPGIRVRVPEGGFVSMDAYYKAKFFTLPSCSTHTMGFNSQPLYFDIYVPNCDGNEPTIVGSSGSDNITGTSGSDVIIGLGGSDTVNGNGGNDWICGGTGTDTIDGGTGTDTCISGEIVTNCEN